MIRIELGAEIDGAGLQAGRGHGKFAYSCVRYPLVCGYSRQPLLDSCRQLKSLYAPTAELVGLFREGRSTPDLTCGLDVGAATTVSEPDDRPIHFTKFREFDSAAFHASESEDVVT